MEQMLLPLFSKEEQLERQVIELKEQCDKVRKSLHAKHRELYKMYLEEKRRLDILEAAICKNTVPEIKPKESKFEF